jgi:hypothetical protein
MTTTSFKGAADVIYVAAADARTDARQQHLLARDAYAADDELLAAEHAARAAELDAIADRLTAAAMAADMADGCDDAEQVKGLIARIREHVVVAAAVAAASQSGTGVAAAIAAASQSGTGTASWRRAIETATDVVSRLSAGASASVTTEA